MSLVGFSARNHPQQPTNPKVDERETAPAFFAPLHREFRFTIDVAATAENTKLDRFYSIEDDGLAQSWAGERVWCNPPYSDIRPWVIKAWDEWRENRLERGPQLIVMLLPANRTEQKWWSEQVEPFRDNPLFPLRTRFIEGRVRFIAPGADGIGPNERPPFGCVLLIWSAFAQEVKTP